MSRSYRLGIEIVLGTVLVSAVLCGFGVNRAPTVAPRAAHDLTSSPLRVGNFQLTERSGRTVSAADLNDRVWVAAFIFTRCPLSCPRISSVMKGMQDRFAKTNVLLVSISVDPDHDTPSVLNDYADRFGALPERWWFLTGEKTAIYGLVQNGFKLALAETTPSEGVEAISHSDRLALVDRGRVVGFFESTEQDAVDELVARASRLAQPGWVRGLPTVNASLNALCALFLVAGWLSIRQRPAVLRDQSSLSAEASASPASLLDRPAVRAHVVCMLLAVATSAIFLGFYLVYHYQAGSMPFRHGGFRRWGYFTILLSHTILATFGVVPLVTVTLFRAVRGDYARHARIARVTFPIWFYVSVTGVVIYVMLYHWPVVSTWEQ